MVFAVDDAKYFGLWYGLAPNESPKVDARYDDGDATLVSRMSFRWSFAKKNDDY